MAEKTGFTKKAWLFMLNAGVRVTTKQVDNVTEQGLTTGQRLTVMADCGLVTKHGRGPETTWSVTSRNGIPNGVTIGEIMACEKRWATVEDEEPAQ